MANQRSILAAARRRWGRDVYIREIKGAPSAKVRAEVQDRARGLREFIDLCNREGGTGTHAAMRERLEALVKAARFVVDVKGDDPSIPQLERSLVQAENLLSVCEQKSIALQQLENLRRGGLAHCYRWTLLQRLSALGSRVLAQADSLEELSAFVERSLAAAREVQS